MPQMDPEMLVLGRLMRAMESVPGQERRVRICRFLMSRCSETWPIDIKAPGPPWDQLTLFIPTPERPRRWVHETGGEITVTSPPVDPEPGDQDRGLVEGLPLPLSPVLTGRSEPPPPSQPETPEVWTPPPAAPAPVPPPAAPVPPPAAPVPPPAPSPMPPPAAPAPPDGAPQVLTGGPVRIPAPGGYPMPAPGEGQPDAGLDGLG